jgi:mono/diheme cytochrome c family protein
MSRTARSTASFIVLLAVGAVACGGGDKPSTDTAATPAAATAPAGEALYTQRCSSCHQANGEGLAGVYPPLSGSEYATAANVGVPIRVLIHGIQGPITVKGAQFNSLMPAYGLGIVMSDAEVASVLTYVRSSWGNSASAVTAADVARVREESKGHTGAITAELLKPLMGN